MTRGEQVIPAAQSSSGLHGATSRLALDLSRPHVDSASAAQRVLWQCGHRSLSPRGQARLQQLAASMTERDWGVALAMARAQGMAPLVFFHTAQAGLLATMPVAITESLGQEYRQTLVSNRHTQTVLVEVLQALATEGIEVIPLKGLALAHRCYGEIALRPMSDIDLLVPGAEAGRAVRVLRRLGFLAAEGMGRPTGFYAVTCAVVVYQKPGAGTIEAHWELFGRAVYRQSLPASDVWRRALTIDFLGQQVRYLHPRDEFWYLCVHAAVEHRLERLIWLVDIAELVRSLPSSWDWRAFVHETIAARLALPVAVALTYCHDALELALPDGLLGQLSAAAATPEEQRAWSAAQADLLSAEGIASARAGIRGPLQAAIFVRGILLPRLPTLAAYYNVDPSRPQSRLSAYAQHLRRTLPHLFAGRT
jgi:hypothetical protein